MIRTTTYLTLAELDEVHARAPRWRAVRGLIQLLAVQRGLGLFYRGPYDVTHQGEILATARRPEAKEAA